jgi:hypothetical protein
MIMSTRERIMYKIDKFPENSLDELDRIITVYLDKVSAEDDFDEQGFWQAIEDCENDNLYGPYDTVEEAMKAMSDDETELTEKLSQALEKNTTSKTVLSLDENDNIIIDKEHHPDLYDWAVNG